MTDRAYITLNTDADRAKAVKWVMGFPDGTRATFVKGDKRTDDQNRLLWPLLQAIAKQVKWHGLTLTDEDFKTLFVDALNRETRMVPNIDGNGFVALGRSTSKLTVGEFSDLIELIMAFGARENVTFFDPQKDAA